MSKTEFTATPTANKAELLEIEAIVPENIIAELGSLQTRGAAVDIKTILRGKSYISIGEAVAFPLAEVLEAHGEELTYEIKEQLKQFEFYRVELSCSFRAAPDCRFHSATFSVELLSAAAIGVEPALLPIAYDLSPDKVTTEVKVNKKYSLGPELTLEFGPLKVGGSLVKDEKAEDYISYNTPLVAFGRRESTAGWSFSRAATQEIVGSQQLFMVVRKPKGTQVAARFNLEAQIEAVTTIGPIGPLPLSTTLRGKGSVTDEPAQPLC